jgi:hypothetical protein
LILTGRHVHWRKDCSSPFIQVILHWLSQLIKTYDWYRTIPLSRVTSHYVIDQSMISIFDMKKMFGSKAMQNPLHRLQCKLIIRYHFWSFSTLNQISILIFLNLYLTSLFYITKINIHFSHWNRGKMLRTPSFTSFK